MKDNAKTSRKEKRKLEILYSESNNELSNGSNDKEFKPVRNSVNPKKRRNTSNEIASQLTTMSRRMTTVSKTKPPFLGIADLKETSKKKDLSYQYLKFIGGEGHVDSGSKGRLQVTIPNKGNITKDYVFEKIFPGDCSQYDVFNNFEDVLIQNSVSGVRRPLALIDR